MHRLFVILIRSMILPMLLVVYAIPQLHAEEPQKPASGPKKLQQRIDFGNAQILGQSIKSGAVYLMHRKKSDISNMLKVRQHYRKEIKEDFGLEKSAISHSGAESENVSK